MVNKGSSTAVEAILDRLPAADIIMEEEKRILIIAEVVGDGVDMWIQSHGDMIKMINEGVYKI